MSLSLMYASENELNTSVFQDVELYNSLVNTEAFAPNIATVKAKEQSVGQLYWQATEDIVGSCSGTLLAGNVFLTARGSCCCTCK